MGRLTLHDYGFALLLGGVVAISPFTPSRWLPSALAGGAVAAGLLVRRAYAPAQPVGSSTASATPRTLDVAGTSASVWISLALYALAFAPTLAWMVEEWTASVWINTHGIFVPIVMVYLARSKLRHGAFEPVRSSAWGFAFLIPSLLLLVADAVLSTRYIASVAFALGLPGLSLLFLGVERTRALAVPLLMGILLVPFPNALGTTLYLREMTTIGTEWLLRLLDVAVLRTGTFLEVSWGPPFLVSDACSGFSALYSGVAIALILASISRSRTRALLLLAISLPLALASNTLRTLLLILLSHDAAFGLGVLDTQIHAGSGVATFAVVLTVLYLLADRDALRQAFS